MVTTTEIGRKDRRPNHQEREFLFENLGSSTRLIPKFAEKLIIKKMLCGSKDKRKNYIEEYWKVLVSAKPKDENKWRNKNKL